MKPTIAAVLLILFGLSLSDASYAQQGKPYRIGVVREGGSDCAAVEGLKEGLKDLGFVEGRDYVVEGRDLQGDVGGLRAAAADLERQKVDLIYSISASVTMAVKRATTKTPIVFAVGSDPAAAGLVDSFAKPGGRLTGVHYATTDLTAKRLEILKAILPSMRKVATFYDPGIRSPSRRSNRLATQGGSCRSKSSKRASPRCRSSERISHRSRRTKRTPSSMSTMP